MISSSPQASAASPVSPHGPASPHGPMIDTAQAPSFESPKLAMWLFLGTEIMFFCGLFSAYYVLRAGATGGNPALWPTREQTHVLPLVGLINTLTLLSSSVALSLALSQLQNGQLSGCVRSLALSLLLGLAFLGIKAWEYSEKFHHGLIPGQIAEAPGPDARRERLLVRGQRVWLDRQRGALESYLAQHEKSTAPEVVDAKEFLALLRDGKKENGDYIRPLTPAEAAEGANALREKHPELPIRPALPNGNLWASFYFTITGIHALHLIAGLVLITMVLLRGLFGALDPNRNDFLANTALYWHFVDLVWLFLFPLIYLL